jgi:hypothetical protein
MIASGLPLAILSAERRMSSRFHLILTFCLKSYLQGAAVMHSNLVREQCGERKRQSKVIHMGEMEKHFVPRLSFV